jgi:hypothetical protein
MNSDTRPSLEEFAKQSGAIIPCPTCSSYDISAGDYDAERMAYGMATNAWKSGQFRMDSREEIMSLMKSVLGGANHRCPSCSHIGD